MVKVYFETPNNSYAELVAIFDHAKGTDKNRDYQI